MALSWGLTVGGRCYADKVPAAVCSRLGCIQLAAAALLEQLTI